MDWKIQLSRSPATITSSWVITLTTMLALAGCKTPASSPSEQGASTTTTAGAAAEAGDDGNSKTARNNIPENRLVLWARPGGDGLETDGEHVVRWRDASGASNHLESPGESPRPKVVTNAVNGHAAVEFDGEDDMLMLETAPDQVPSVTVFLVVAPEKNSGAFDGLISAGRRAVDDHWSGFNIDLGGKNFKGCAKSYPESLDAFSTINVESVKNGGNCGEDLLGQSAPFGQFALVTAIIGSSKTRLRFNGEPQSDTAGGPETVHLQQLRVGARYHHQKFQGYFEGKIAEIILYGRVLSDEEIAAVETALMDYYDL